MNNDLDPLEFLVPEEIARQPGRTIHFACTACGKCCNGPPILTIEEGFELADVFFMSGELRFDTRNIDLYDLTERRFTTREGIRSMTWAVELLCTPLDWTQHNKRCPVLQPDMRCGIYERRPTHCRVVPFDYRMSPQNVSKAPQFDIALAKKWEFACDWSEAAPVIVSPEGVVDAETKTAYEAARASYNRSQLYIHAIDKDTLDEMYNNARANALRGRLPEHCLPFTMFVIMGVVTNHLSRERAEAILRQQIDLGKKRVAEALKRGNKAERQNTAHIRSSIKMAEITLADFDGALHELVANLASWRGEVDFV